MSIEPLTKDSEMQITHIPVKDIYSDAEFNTRMKINPIDCVDLAKTIARDGLQQPIIVRSGEGHKGCPPEYKWVVIAGHRRLMAFTINGTETIPAVIRHDLSDFAAKKINVIENLKRVDLNILEQANCIKPWKDEGHSREDIAIELGMSPGWVQIREMVLDLPPEIQQECAKGTFGAVQIRDLNKLKKDPEQQLVAARKLKEAKQKGESKTTDQVLQKPVKATVKKQRNNAEIRDLMRVYKETFGRFDLATRMLAWITGEIDNGQLHHSIWEQAQLENVPYTMPDLDLS